MVRLGRGEFMVAVVDGRRQRRSVYVRYFSYYSYFRHARHLFFWWSAVEKTVSRQNHFKRNPVNTLVSRAKMWLMVLAMDRAHSVMSPHTMTGATTQSTTVRKVGPNSH